MKLFRTRNDEVRKLKELKAQEKHACKLESKDEKIRMLKVEEDRMLELKARDEIAEREANFIRPKAK
jgi:hypothetical protein